MSTGLVRAADYRFLNDVSEILHTDHLLRELITNKLKESPAPTLNLLYASLLEGRTFLQDEELVHIFSMTEEADSLSQWRAYARDGKGFTLGFDGRHLANLANSEHAQFGLRRVVYDEISQRTALSDALDTIEARYRKDIQRRVDRPSLLAEVARLSGIWLYTEAARTNTEHLRSRKSGVLRGFLSNPAK